MTLHFSRMATPSLGGRLLLYSTKNCSPQKRTTLFKAMAACLTYLTYMAYTMVRRPFVVAIPTLENGSFVLENGTMQQIQAPWLPFGNDRGNWYIAGLNLLFLAVYAVSMFAAGWVAGKIDLRYCLVTGLALR